MKVSGNNTEMLDNGTDLINDNESIVAEMDKFRQMKHQE